MTKSGLYTWLVDPIRMIPGFIAVQFIMWWAFMPDEPDLYGIAPKFVSIRSITLFVILFASLLFGLLIGRSLFRPNPRFLMTGPDITYDTIKFYKHIAAIALLLTIIGEGVYIRPILENRSLLQDALGGGHGLGLIGQMVSNESVAGLSSLNNLLLIPVTIYTILGFGRAYPQKESKKYRAILLAIGVFVVLHSVLLAARMYFIYYSLTVIAVLIIEYRPNSKKFAKWLFLGIVGVGCIVFYGELLRYGWQYATISRMPLLSLEVFDKTLRYLMQAYFASDVNNAFVLLSSEPSLQMVSTGSPIFNSLLSGGLGIDVKGFSDLQLWKSGYGTVNIIGLWWYDWGYFSIMIASVLGICLGGLYTSTISKSGVSLSPGTLLFVLSFPGFFAICRINYYLLTIYIIPVIYLAIMLLLKQSTKPMKRFARKDNQL